MTTPTPPVSPTPELAKDWIVEVDTSTTETPTWTKVRAITQFTPNMDFTNQDASTYDSGIWKGKQVTTQIGWGCSMTLLRNRYADAEDAGQKLVREAAVPDATTGQLKAVHLRFYDSHGGPEAYEGFASVTWEPQGGGVTDLRTVNVTASGDGERLTITNPTDTP